MKQNYISVPFKSDSGSGFTEYNGIAKFSSAGIVLEFEGKLFGLVGGEVKEVRVALDEILQIRFRKGIFKFFAQLQLRLQNFSKISKLPNDNGKIKLKIKREDFEFAKEAYEQTLQYMNNTDQKSLETMIDEPDQLPPPKTSVNELFDTKKLTKEESKETNKLKK